MVILIAGASHTGKTALAQKILEKYHIPYLSIDHLKMGLIRSGQTSLTPNDTEALVGYLWPILREMIKTAVENGQNLVIEGCYIPFDWKDDFTEMYLKEIQYCCLIFSVEYIRRHFTDIKRFANVIEQRPLNEECTIETIMKENTENLEMCQKYGCRYILIEENYSVDI